MNRRRPKLLIAALYAALVLCAIASACSRRQTPATNLDGLKETLKQTAERKLAAPSLANEQLIITDAPENIEARTQEVIDAAIQAGGTAVKTTNADGSVLLMAQVPNINAELFRGLVRKERVVKEKPTRSGDMRLIEVTIKPQISAPGGHVEPGEPTAQPAASP